MSTDTHDSDLMSRYFNECLELRPEVSRSEPKKYEI